MTDLNPREEMISLMRGLFACPVIATLGKHGLLTQLCDGSFREADAQVSDPKLLHSVLQYLASIGLLEACGKDGKGWQPTYLGNKVFNRFGSFVLLNSYRSLAADLERLLFRDLGRITCDRRDNVIGSGLTNGRRFFPAALEILTKLQPKSIVDVGCGDGTFLLRVLEQHPAIRVGAVDLSEQACLETTCNFKREVPDREIVVVQEDAASVSAWVEQVRPCLAESPSVISMWYLLHEISHGSPATVMDYLWRVKEAFPEAHLIIGEIVNLPPEMLAENRRASVMPEFLLFHAGSGQGVLSWTQWEEVRCALPYYLEHEYLFDCMDSEQRLPSAFVWHLAPFSGN